MKFVCESVKELKLALNSWPDDKPLIFDVDGNTMPLIIEDWADEDSSSLNWPVAVIFSSQGGKV